MIKFFRKIRQKLLAENKFSKYLIYAIGEIVLVVIGILIALQINNWNEAKKFKVEVFDQLVILSKDLEYDISQYTIMANYMPKNIDYVEKLSQGRFEQLDLKNFWDPVANNLSSLANVEAYKTLKSTGGFNLIDDPVLVSKLSNYFNDLRERYVNFQKYDANITEQYIEPKLLDILEWDDNNQLVEENIKRIILERKLHSIYNQRLEILNSGYELANYNLIEVRELKEALTEYISKNNPVPTNDILNISSEEFQEIELTQEKLEMFTGRYARFRDTISIKLEQNQLFVETTDGRRIYLFPYAEDKLFVKSFYDQLNFEKEEDEFIGFTRMQTYSFYEKTQQE